MKTIFLSNLKMLLLAVSICICSTHVAQNAFPDGTFQRGYGTAGDDEAFAVCKTLDKGWVAAGYSNGFGTDKDFYLVKFDSNGVVVWSTHLNALGIESATGIKQAANGDLIVVGNTKASNLSNSYSDVLLARYSAGGALIWQQLISNSTTSNDEANELLELPNGNIFIAGATNATFSAGDAMIWITDASGNVLSSKLYSRTGKEVFNDCEFAYDGNILLCSPSTNGSIDIIWLLKLDTNGDTVWTKHYDYNYNFIRVNALTEMLNKQIVIVGSERPGFGNSNSYLHVVDSAGNFSNHTVGLTLLSDVYDVAASVTNSSGSTDIFLQTGPYNSFQPRFGIASSTPSGFGVYWRFLDPPTYANYNYTISPFNTQSNAVVTDVYDTYFIGSCIVGATRLSAYGGLDFAIARSNFQETVASSLVPCISSDTTSICAGDSVKLFISCQPKLTQRWMRLSAPANYNLGTDSVFYAKDAGIYCLASFNSDSTLWLSNILIIDVLDTSKPIVTITGANPFCGASGQSVVLSIPASLFSTYQWYKDSVLLSGATNRTFTATSSGSYYCVRTNNCGSVASSGVDVNAFLPPAHLNFTMNPFPTVSIIHPWCQSGAYDIPIEALVNSSYSYAWYLTTSTAGTQLISTTFSCLPQDTGYLYCITNNACGVDTSDTLKIIDFGPPTPGPYPSGLYPPTPIVEKVCPGFSIQLSAPYIWNGQYNGPYMWFRNGIPFSSDSVITVTNVGIYTVTFMEPMCSPIPIESKPVTIQYHQPLVPASMTITASGTVVCQTPQYLYAPSFPGFTNWNYAWKKVGTNYSWAGDTLQVQQWMGSGDYYCTLSNGWCSTVLTSNIIHIDVVYSQLTTNVPASLCSSPGGVLFSIASPIVGAQYQWFKDTTFQFLNGQAIAGANGTSYFATQSASYYAEITYSGCTVATIQKTLSGTTPSLNFGLIVEPVCGVCNGMLSVVVSPGVSAPQWENGSFSWSRNNLCPGTYIAHSTDAGGCVVADTITLVNQSPISISQSNPVIPSPGNCDGQISFNATGGTGPYSYVVSPIPPVTGYCDSTTYTLTVTDASGCVEIDTLYFFPAGMVWPGDANSDLIANNFDLFPIGQAYGNTGPVRNNASLLWIGQAANDWTDSIGFVNNKHVDCNGDGVIDVQDTLAISMNYGSIHFRGVNSESSSLVAPELFFTNSIDTAQAGDNLQIPIHLGTSSLPVDSIYGIAFTIQYSKPVVDSLSVFARFDSCWIGMINSNLISIQKDNYSQGKFDLAIVRTDKLNQSGHGMIGVLNIDMKDDLSGRADIYKLLALSFSNIQLIQFDGTLVPVNPLNDSIVVHDEITALTELDKLNRSILVSPNPATSFVLLDLGTAKGKVSEIAVSTSLGKRIMQTKIGNEAMLRLSTDAFVSGIYYVHFTTDMGQVVKKLVIAK